MKKLLILLTLSLSLSYVHLGLASEAKRIIALSPHAVEMLYAIGVGDRIVGTVEYADYPEEAKEIPRIGSYTGIQIEQVVALKADLVVTWKSGNKLADINKIKSLGLNMFDSLPKDIQGISEEILALGELTGAQLRAKKVSEEILSQHREIKKHYANKKKVKVFYQLWHDPLRTIGKTSWIETMIRDCNGENLFNDTESGYPLVSLESVLVKNPEVIIIPHHSGEVGAKTDIWDKWKNIEAVKKQRLFTLNGDILHRFGPRAIQGLKALCEAIDSAR